MGQSRRSNKDLHGMKKELKCVWTEVKNQVMFQVDNQVSDRVRNQLWKVCDTVWDQVETQVRFQVWYQTRTMNEERT